MAGELRANPFPLLCLVTSLCGQRVKMETLSVEELSKLMEENDTPESVVLLLERMYSLLCSTNIFSSVRMSYSFTYLVFLLPVLHGHHK